MSVKGKIHSVETFGAVDGPGIRYIVFMQGCPLRCIYCHNPDAWEADGGTEKTVDEVMADILSYKNFLSGGVTISGGEPLFQPEFTKALLMECKKHKIHTALDTAGSIPIEDSSSIIDLANMLLLDIKAENEDLYKSVTKNDNAYKNAIDTLNYCESIGKPVWIRHVIIPGVTLDFDMLEKLNNKLKQYKCVARIDLLPFHKLGEYKWKQLHAEYELSKTLPPDEEAMIKAKEIFS